MFISAAEVRINSSGERFGFRCDFKSGLNVIRGNNSSGKSTLVNTLMYGLGLEEVVGMKGERALTSAVRDSFQFDGGVRQIDESAVLVEVRNAAGRTVTFRRPIKNADKSTKLVEVFDGALLTDNTIVARTPVSLFLHDGGAAQDDDPAPIPRTARSLITFWLYGEEHGREGGTEKAIYEGIQARGVA
ncbi:AAA family ATPase, partial [Burkholderia dolosa]|nr:AAA family ATPase [Burkholderia dolosa]